MKIKLARTSGFCYGVRRAVNLAFDEALKTENLYTLGELIHNPQVLEILARRGAKVVDDVDEVPDGASVIIRSHGVSPRIRQALDAKNINLIDATCPKVARVQQLAAGARRKGNRLIIFGDPDHSEVQGIAAYGGSKTRIVRDCSQLNRVLRGIPRKDTITLVAQTTQNLAAWDEIKQALLASRPGSEVYETICGATDDRQQDVKKLAGEVEAVVVVGGFHSGNTRRLVEIVSQQGVPAFHVETEAQLPRKELSGYQSIGVAAGASTPSWIIRRVLHALERVGKKKTVSSFFTGVWQFIVRSNLLVAFGAAQLLYAASRLQGIEPELHYQWIVASYIFGMHLLNHFTDAFATQIKYPARVGFYARFRRFLLTLGLLGIASSLMVSYRLGPLTFIMIFTMTILGLMYRVELFSKSQSSARRLMDIPGSKDIFLGLAWTVVIALLVVPASNSRFTPATGITALFVFAIAFTRSLAYSIRDVQGDRMVGRETIPVLIGEGKTRTLGTVILSVSALGLIAGWYLEWCTPLALILLINLAYGFLTLWLTRGDSIKSDVFFETIVEGNLISSQFFAYFAYLAGLLK